MTSLDSDGDGRISMDEAPDQMKGFFGQMDRNGDGFIAADELQAGPGAGGARGR